MLEGTTSMKLAVLFSGGKDSCLALHKVLEQGHEVSCLLNINPQNFDSFMFHKPYLNVLRRQAEELGIELIIEGSEGEKEEELGDLRRLIEKVKNEVEGIVVGGIASSYQGTRVKKICEELDLEFVAPILDYSPDKVWKELLEAGFETILSKIACDGLSRDWIGKVINKESFQEFKKLGEKYKFRIDFEGGEAESLVLNMPGFKKEIKIDFSAESEGEYRHFMTEVILKN
jgi:diphthine-ammonia ligase